MADPATLAMLAKAAAAVLSSEKARKTIGWVIVAIFSPIIVLLVLLCSLLSGTAEHNTTALELCFHGGVISASVPEDYRGHIENMRDSFFVLDGGAAELDGQMENGDSLDRTRVKAIFYALYFGEEQPSQRAHKQYLDCFVTYEERTRTVTEADDAGNEVEVEETYTVAVPIRDLSVVYENIRSKMGTEITAEDQANATEIYYRTGFGDPGVARSRCVSGSPDSGCRLYPCRRSRQLDRPGQSTVCPSSGCACSLHQTGSLWCRGGADWNRA